MGRYPASQSIFSRKPGTKSSPFPLSLLCHDGASAWGADHRAAKHLRDVPSSRVTEQQRELDARAGSLVPVLPWAVEMGAGRRDPRGQGSKGCSPGSLQTGRHSRLQLRLSSESQAGSIPSAQSQVQLRGVATLGERLSSPLKMGCDLLQSLPFGFRDTGQSEKDTEDAEGGGEPEGAVGPEHLLQRVGRGRVCMLQVRGPHGSGAKALVRACPAQAGDSAGGSGTGIQELGLSSAKPRWLCGRGH